MTCHPQRYVILFLDNEMAHRAKAFRRLLEKHGYHVQIEWLPTYSPGSSLPIPRKMSGSIRGNG